MVRTNRARSLAGLVFLFAVTSLVLALVRRTGGAVSAFVSSPVSPLPSPPFRQPPQAGVDVVWSHALGAGLILVGLVLVVLGLGWWARSRR